MRLHAGHIQNVRLLRALATQGARAPALGPEVIQRHDDWLAQDGALEQLRLGPRKTSGGEPRKKSWAGGTATDTPDDIYAALKGHFRTHVTKLLARGDGRPTVSCHEAHRLTAVSFRERTKSDEVVRAES